MHHQQNDRRVGIAEAAGSNPVRSTKSEPTVPILSSLFLFPGVTPSKCLMYSFRACTPVRFRIHGLTWTLCVEVIIRFTFSEN